MQRVPRFFLASLCLHVALQSSEIVHPSAPPLTSASDRRPAAQAASADDQAMKEQMIQQMIERLRNNSTALASLVDKVRSSITTVLLGTIRDHKITKKRLDREHAEAWILALNENLNILSDTLHDTKLIAPELLLSAGASLALIIQQLEEGMKRRFSKEYCFVENIPTQQDTEGYLTRTLEEVRSIAQTELDTQRIELPDEIRSQLPTVMPPELIAIKGVDYFLKTLNEDYQSFTEHLSAYGITKVNKAARVIDAVGRKVVYHDITQPLLLAGGAVLASYISYLFLRSKPGTDWYAAVVGSVLAQSAMQAGGAIWNTWYHAMTSRLGFVKNRSLEWWNRVQGLPKKRAEGFQILQPEDFEGPEDRIIGLEAQFNHVMDSIRATLARQEQGDQQPLAGVQKSFLFVGPAGTGKTRLAAQLKRDIARWTTQVGMKIAFEEVGPETMIMGELLAKIQEAQARGVALVLFIDEMHMFKPMKDGNTPLLYALLKLEKINKENIPIWVFCATNEPGKFDKALIRSGRFEIVHIYEPSYDNRVEMFAYYLARYGLILKKSEIRLLAAQTHGCSPATIIRVIDSARTSGTHFSRQELQRAMDAHVFHLTDGFESQLSKSEQRLVAAYQAGRALIHIHQRIRQQPSLKKLYQSGRWFLKVTASAIQNDIQELPVMGMDAVISNRNFEKRRIWGQVFFYEGSQQLGMGTGRERKNTICDMLAGTIAQELFIGIFDDTHRREDFKNAYQICLELTTEGLALDLLSETAQNEYKDKALKLFNDYKGLVTKDLQRYATTCKSMMQAMLEQPTAPHLNALEIIKLYEQDTGTSEKVTPQDRTTTPRRATTADVAAAAA